MLCKIEFIHELMYVFFNLFLFRARLLGGVVRAQTCMNAAAVARRKAVFFHKAQLVGVILRAQARLNASTITRCGAAFFPRVRLLGGVVRSQIRTKAAAVARRKAAFFHKVVGPVPTRCAYSRGCAATRPLLQLPKSRR